LRTTKEERTSTDKLLSAFDSPLRMARRMRNRRDNNQCMHVLLHRKLLTDMDHPRPACMVHRHRASRHRNKRLNRRTGHRSPHSKGHLRRQHRMRARLQTMDRRTSRSRLLEEQTPSHSISPS
jgi:hypothetical protein